MKEFISTFMFLQRFNCIEAIDEMFRKMIKEDWSKESLETNLQLIITFLRSNFIIKEKLANYSEFLEKSLKYLESNNIDPKSILYGII